MSVKFVSQLTNQDDDLICASVEAAKAFDGLTDANQYFAGLCQSVPGFVKLENNVYHYKEYYVNVGKRFLMARHADGLKSLNRLGLSCLPEFIAFIWLDNDHDMVLVTRVKGSANCQLMPCSCLTEIPEQARRKLLANVDRLMEENYAVLAVTEGSDSWYFLENEEKIFFSSCELVFVSDEAKAAYRKRVLEKLGLSK